MSTLLQTGTTEGTSKDTTWRWLLLLNLAAAFYNVGSVWLAQLNWQLWQYVGQTTFGAYHGAWFRGIWWAIFPLAGLALIGVCAQIKWRPPRVPPWAVWLELGLHLTYIAGTIFWWAPGQANLHDAVLANGALDPHYQILVLTNWLRVALITAAGLLELWIAARSFIPGKEPQPGGR
jgi:hypothetical protein